MGAYVSMPECQSHYNITVNCDYKVNATELNGTAPTIGGYGRREIPTDPDVAGIGVCRPFPSLTPACIRVEPDTSRPRSCLRSLRQHPLP